MKRLGQQTQSAAAAGRRREAADASVLFPRSARRLPQADASDILFAWQAELQEVNARYEAMLPELRYTELTHAERLQLSGSGHRRYGYIDTVSDVADACPQFWPTCTNDNNTDRMKSLIRNIEALESALIFFENRARVVRDLRLLCGDESYRLANMYYVAVRESARYKAEQADQVWKELRLYWKRRRKSDAEPTQKEIVRDAKAVMHGTKVGEVCVTNEGDRVSMGQRTIVDETYTPTH